MEDISYYETQLQSWTQRSQSEQTPARGGHTAGFRGRSHTGRQGRGRGRTGVNYVQDGVSPPTINDHGRQTSKKVTPISTLETFNPRKRDRSAMTTMHYGDLSYNETASVEPSVKEPACKKNDASGGVLPRSRRDPAGVDDLSGVAMDVDPAPEVLPQDFALRRSAYSKEQLAGPATANGLPSFPNTKPQQPPSTAQSTRPLTSSEGFVRWQSFLLIWLYTETRH